MFLGLELPAVKRTTPWLPLSDFVWFIEAEYRPAAVAVLLSFGWLLIHLVSGWSWPTKQAEEHLIDGIS